MACPADQGWQTAIETQGNVVPPRIAPSDPPRRTAEFLTEKAIAFIEANRARPFLLQVSHFAVHIPLSTTPELKQKYEAKKPMPNYPSRPEYAGLLEELDQSVGRIVETVDRLGLGENTLLVFVSDNGGLHFGLIADYSTVPMDKIVAQLNMDGKYPGREGISDRRIHDRLLFHVPGDGQCQPPKTAAARWREPDAGAQKSDRHAAARHAVLAPAALSSQHSGERDASG